MRVLPTVGTEVSVRYIPMPYLGTGIVEPVVVSGVVAEPRMFKGVTYLILKDAEGKVVLERNVNEIEEIMMGAAPEVPETFSNVRKTSYNRV